jgi:cell division protein FtsL
MARMSKSKTPLLVKLLMLGFLLYAVVTIVSLQTQIADKREQLDSLNMRVQEYEAANEALRQEMQSGITEADISEIARTELSYAEPGERVFVDTSSR